jgi:hypothetical protein
MTMHKDKMLFGLFSCKRLIQYMVDDIYVHIIYTLYVFIFFYEK